MSDEPFDWRTLSDAHWRRESDGQLDVDLLRPYLKEHGCLPPTVEENTIDATPRLLAAMERLKQERDQ